MPLRDGGDVCELDGHHGGVFRETLRGVLSQGNLITDHLSSPVVAFARCWAGQSAMAEICKAEESKSTPDLHC